MEKIRKALNSLRKDPENKHTDDACFALRLRGMGYSDDDMSLVRGRLKIRKGAK